ncbi:hypothetical protein Bca52824_041801 [Brassica carinata]|uniref:non-specific serine/threonine protein kinase n=1 Tax=Brassica carinata TaxID=52824 RepID=A0A8X7RW56_BRACI|nr:hypothetical protein Bca52824_041801 [Brassica carinata]
MVVDKTNQASPLCCVLPMYDTKHSSNVTEDDSNDLSNTTKHKRANAMLTNSASAHGRKEKQDPESPRGTLEACLNRCSISSSEDPPQNKEATENADADVRCKNHRASSNWGKFFKLWKRRKHNRERRLRRGLPRNTTRGKLIAVKRLTKGTPDEQTAEFLSELGIIAHVDHPNTAKFIGCCTEDGMYLVFRLSPLGSLGSLLHGPSKDKLTWSRRYKVALGTADGLMYLHEGCQRRIIHRDIKADNILLTEDFQPQICDFGLAKWLPKQLTHHNVSKFEGTFGYFAPEYFMHGIVDEKTDVFSFGVLLLELITGHPALDESQQSLVLWAKPLLEKKDIKKLVDPSLGDEYDQDELNRLTSTASLCIEQSSLLRPRMSQVVESLLGQESCVVTPREDKRKMMQRTYSEELLDSIEYNSTRHLRDLDRIREVALAS